MNLVFVAFRYTSLCLALRVTNLISITQQLTIYFSLKSKHKIEQSDAAGIDNARLAVICLATFVSLKKMRIKKND